MSDSDSENQDLDNSYPDMSMPEPQPEEHLWLGTLSKDSNVIKFEGCDDAESNLILKRATLDGDCNDDSRHVVQIISLDHSDKRISGTLCSLNMKQGLCSIGLDSLVVSPPTAFKLIKGDGPLTLTANLMKEVDPSLLDEEDEEDLDNIADRVNGDVEDSDEEEDENRIEEMETSSEEEAEKENKKPQKAAPKVAAVIKKPESPKKRKNDEEQKPDNKKPKMTASDVKAKIETNKDKPARAPITTAKELIEAKASKGGRPSKRNKFNNWVKNQFKVDNSEWTEKAWKVLQEK